MIHMVGRVTPQAHSILHFVLVGLDNEPPLPPFAILTAYP